ncbi:DHA2 family multidrug resistance protein-like MFS transporter [Nonomuraea polychroma]|uniref:DHA2 family multidrug resistance protein-like MFS transporter n=1 Tax=Nonomuraea polychroma TaxID=46176 RepID=A0A438M6M9_9ACTN|nr:MFS transporter [Nonomuraea polychroma]RVX41346.1 DHA2 family multidrug resistance protein-like MFS transporter [Nonomuraea polychroma]
MTTTMTTTRAGGRAWLGLSVLALATLLLAVDNTVLVLALPHLAADLNPSATELLWITDVYGFMIAGFMITMGSLGDRIGRRRLLLIGAAAFAAASVVAAYSTTTTMLIAARVLLGVAGAAMGPSALALVAGLFADARQRAMAIGVFTACFMGGAAAGPVIGGFLLENFWWGSVFLMGVPVMALVVVGGLALLPETAAEGAGRLDPASVAMSMAAILPVVYGLKELADDPRQVAAYAALVVGLAFCVAFVRRQRRLAEPLVDLRLFANRSFSAALLIMALAMVVQGGVYLFVSQHLQLVEGLSPLVAGLWMAVPALALVGGSLAAPVIAGAFRPGLVAGVGLIVSAAGFALVMAGDGLGMLVTGVTIAFLGMAPVGALGLDLIVGSAPPERSGSASALAECGGELGVALGIALLGSVGNAVYGGLVTSPRAGDSLSEALAAAAGLPPGPAAALVAEAQAAFGHSLLVVTAVSAVLVLGLAVTSMTLLRHLRPIGQEKR